MTVRLSVLILAWGFFYHMLQNLFLQSHQPGFNFWNTFLSLLWKHSPNWYYFLPLFTSAYTLFFFQFSNSSSFASVTSNNSLTQKYFFTKVFPTTYIFKIYIFIVLSSRSLMLNQHLFFPDALSALFMTNALFGLFEPGSS